MIDRHISARVVTLRRGWAALHLQLRALIARAPHHDEFELRKRRLRRLLVARRSTLIRVGIGAGALVGVVGIAFVALWLRLASGPLALDAATPWLTAAIEERFGGRHRVEVGGTQLERDEEGRTALRLRDIVVRDGNGTVVASAPKAEVGLSGRSLLMGRVQAVRLSLIGAAMSVRVEPD